MNNYEYINQLDAGRNSQSALIMTLAVCAAISTVAAIGFYVSMDRAQKQLQAFRIAQYEEGMKRLKNGNGEGNGENEAGNS